MIILLFNYSFNYHRNRTSKRTNIRTRTGRTGVQIADKRAHRHGGEAKNQQSRPSFAEKMF